MYLCLYLLRRSKIAAENLHFIRIANIYICIFRKVNTILVYIQINNNGGNDGGDGALAIGLFRFGIASVEGFGSLLLLPYFGQSFLSYN